MQAEKRSKIDGAVCSCLPKGGVAFDPDFNLISCSILYPYKEM